MFQLLLLDLVTASQLTNNNRVTRCWTSWFTY